MFNSRCPRGIVLINMDDFQNTIIGIHNKFRNDLANGYVDGLYRARGLPEVVSLVIPMIKLIVPKTNLNLIFSDRYGIRS